MQHAYPNTMETIKASLCPEGMIRNPWCTVTRSKQLHMFAKEHDVVHSCSGHDDASTKFAEALSDQACKQRLSHAVT